MTTMKNPNSSSTKLAALLSHIKYEHLVAGISGGVTSTLILHPLDLIKIRFAVNDGRTATVPRYDGLGSAFVTIVKKEGFRGLYRGVTPNVWGSGSAWGFYFLFYNAIKTWIQGGNARTPLGPGLHMLAAAEAGVLSLLMTNPIWVVKTRLCLQYSEEQLADNKRYKGMVDGLTKIYRTEGIRGLYRGFVPGMFGVSHGALQFMTYEEMKNRYNQYRNLPIDIKLTSMEYLTFAAISKLIAAGATYPYQVVRARLQDQHRSYNGAWHCVTETWRHERIGGFYKGLKPSLVRVVPATMVTFLTYENVSHYLLQRSRNLALSSYKRGMCTIVRIAAVTSRETEECITKEALAPISPLKKHSRSCKKYRVRRKIRNLKMSNASPSAERREHLYKILVIGELGTGKTSIIKRYVHQFFSQHYRATIGVDFALKVLNWDANTIIRLQLWDIAGQERFGNMTRVYYKEAVGAFIVFDVSRVATFDAVVKWKNDLDTKVQLPDGSPIPCILLANKCDQQKEGIVNSPAKMEEYCREKGFAGWFETSAKENINIEEAARSLVNKILLNDKLLQSSDGKDSDRFALEHKIANGENSRAGSSKSCAC